MKVKVEYTEDFKGKPALQVSVSIDGKEYENITIYSLLCLAHWIFRSEDIRFPPEEGYEGRRKLFRALKEVCSGQLPEVVVANHQCAKGTLDAVEFIENPTEEEWEKMRKGIFQKTL